MISGAGSGNRTRTLSLEGSYDTISPYPRRGREVCQRNFNVKAGSAEYLLLRADNRAKPVLSRIHFPTRALTIEGKGACTDNNRSPYQSQTIWPFAKKHIA